MSTENLVDINKLIMSLSDEEIDALFERFISSIVAQVTREGRFETH